MRLAVRQLALLMTLAAMGCRSSSHGDGLDEEGIRIHPVSSPTDLERLLEDARGHGHHGAVLHFDPECFVGVTPVGTVELDDGAKLVVDEERRWFDHRAADQAVHDLGWSPVSWTVGPTTRDILALHLVVLLDPITAYLTSDKDWVPLLDHAFLDEGLVVHWEFTGHAYWLLFSRSDRSRIEQVVRQVRSRRPDHADVLRFEVEEAEYASQTPPSIWQFPELYSPEEVEEEDPWWPYRADSRLRQD